MNNMQTKYDIFISYRREGGYDTAKHLNDLLVRDGYRVSFDIDTLRGGKFDTQLYERIDQCKDFILVVDEHAFDRIIFQNTAPGEDWMRCELAYALSKHKNVIPVFLSGEANFPDDLPEDIRGVTRMNAPRYDRYYFNEFYATLKERFLTSSSTQKRNRLYSFLIPLLVVIIGVTWLLYHSTEVCDLFQDIATSHWAKPTDFPNEEKVQHLLQTYAQCIENKDYNGLKNVYAPKVLRYHNIKETISREEVIRRHRDYEYSHGAYGMQASYRLNTLTINPVARDRAEVTCVLDYSIHRVDENKPSCFVLEHHLVIDDNYHICSIYEEKLNE